MLEWGTLSYPDACAGFFRSGIRLLPLQEAYRMEQEISLVFPRSQENHPRTAISSRRMPYVCQAAYAGG